MFHTKLETAATSYSNAQIICISNQNLKTSTKMNNTADTTHPLFGHNYSKNKET